MRDFLTGIAIIVIVVLTTILVAPYFVDWNGQRDFLEARLSHALGQKVTVGGAIDLKLLPTPYLVLDQVVVGGDEAPIRVGVRHLNLELAISPLLHGEFDIVEARLREPTIRATLDPDHSFPTLPAAPAFSADVRFDRIRVEDGTLAIADPTSGRTFVIDHLDLDADADSFAGPFKIVGAGGSSDRRTSFRLSTGEAKHGRVRARLSIDENTAHAGVEFDGSLDLQRAGEAVTQRADGKLVLAGHLRRLDKDPVAWRLSGSLKAGPQQAQLENGELRVGGDDAGITLQADAHAEFGEAAKLALDLKAKQLDIDRLSGVQASGAHAPPQIPDWAELRSLLTAATPAIPTTFELSVETATYASETLSGIALRTTLGDEAAHPLSLAADGPGGSHVIADGTLTAGPNPSFAGKLDLAVEDLPRAIDWVRAVAPTFPWTGSEARFNHVRLTGPVLLDSRTISSTKLDLVLDRTKIAGSVRLAFGAEQPSKLTADLKSQALDIDRLPTLDRVIGFAGGFDLDLRLDAKAVKVSQLGDGALNAGQIHIDLGRSGDSIDVRALQIDDLGGAAVQASGDLESGGGRLKVKLDAGRLNTAADLVRRLAPGAIADALVARASALAPAKLTVDASLRRKGGTYAPTHLAILGNVASTKIEARAEPGSADATSFSMSLRSADGGALLHQLGFATVPIEAIGASHLSLEARGTPGQLLDTKLEASFGATTTSVSGRFDLLTSAPNGSGDIQLRSADLAPLLQTLAIAFPDMTQRLPASAKGRLDIGKEGVTVGSLAGQVAGVGTRGTLRWQRAAGGSATLTGDLDIDRLSLSSVAGLATGPEQATQKDAAWSRQPFGVGLIDPPRSAFSVHAAVLDILPGLNARNAKLDLDVSPNALAVENLTAEIARGKMSAQAKLRRDGRQATAEGRLVLDKVHVDLPSTLDASLDAKLDFAGAGTSAFALISSLAGSGDATASGLRIAGADPKALRRIFDDVEADVLAVDQDAVVRAYNEIERGPLSAGEINFGLRLASGVVHFDPRSKNGSSEMTTDRVDVSLDIPRARLSAHVQETLRALPTNWSGSPPTIDIALDGPLGRPSRSVDVSGFLNAVAARALARESARIEAYELDVRERAFFNERLQSERRREDERQKAEEDARKAEAERKARLEAARQERLRKDQAAKDAEEKATRDGEDRGARSKGDESSQGEGSKRTKEDDRPKADEPARSDASKDPSSFGRY